MSSGPVDPGVQALLDESRMLPDCAARNSLLERAAIAAEALNDTDTAWDARCSILASTSSLVAPRFETLFMCLAWCLAMSERDPDRFRISNILWQYKWVVTNAPDYASVPRSVLERLVDDMDHRFQDAGWGRRAGLHKRVQVLIEFGEPERALELSERWRALPRDRGSDCPACEASTFAGLLALLGHDELALREARPIIAGRLACATVPHSTYGLLLLPLVRLGRHAQARELYEKGRRLVAATEEAGVTLVSNYLVYSGYIGDTQNLTAMLRARLPRAVSLHSDGERYAWFGHAALALDFIARHGVEELQLPDVPGFVAGPTAPVATLATRFREIAGKHADALNKRNGNQWLSNRLATLADQWPPMVA